jgi:hypothetical protein
MPKFYLSFIAILMPLLTLKGQITVTATAGTATGSYVNLKTTFDAINNGEHQGIITILINASVTESITARLDSSSGLSAYTNIHIMPAVACTISGNVNGPLIDLNGADSVIIDGRINGAGTARSLTIRNTYSAVSTDVSTIRLANGASHNIMRYLNVQGSAQGYDIANIFIADSYNNMIDNNEIGPAGANRPCTGIGAGNHSIDFSNTSNVISHNLIHDFYSTSSLSAGIYIAESDRYTITGNSIYQTLPVTDDLPFIHQYIAVNYGEGHVISNNFIGGSVPNAGGAATVYNGNTSVAGIVVYDIGLTVPTKIDGNMIRDFSLSYPSTTRIIGAFRGISVSSGRYEVGLVNGNTISDITVSFSGDFVSSTVTGISCSGSTSDNNMNVQNNAIRSFTINAAQGGDVSITGISCNDLTTFHLQHNMIDSFQNNAVSGSISGISLGHQVNGAQYTCTQNTIQHLYNNCSGSSAATITGIASILFPQNNNTVKNFITSNQISDLHSAGKSATDGSVRGIHIKLYSSTANSFINSTISNNQISNLLSESIGGSTVVEGADNECPFNLFLNIDSNNIHHLTNAAANVNTFSLSAVQGIRSVISANAPVNITANTIHDLASTSSAATWVTGISCLYGSSNNVLTLSKNHIYKLRNDSSLTGCVTGIHIKGAAGSGVFTIKNNMISLMPDRVKIYAIYNSATAANLNLFYNSVLIAGFATGTNRSGAFYRSTATNTSKVLSRDNIFYNIRHGGTGNHYALMNDNVTAGNGWNSSNFNNLYSDSAATVALWGSASMSFADYLINSHQDSSSKSIPVDFTDISNGDLHLLNTSNNQSLAGIAVTGITDDIDGDPRHPDPAMGADEITLNSQPPVITASGPLAFCEGGHVILRSSAAAGNQWYKDGVIIPGATAQSYQVEQTGEYKVVYMQISSDTVNVSVSAVSILDTVVSNVLCTGTASGAVHVSVSGDSSLTYTWSNGARTKDLMDVFAGTYQLFVSDKTGCKDSVYVTVMQPDSLHVSETHQDISCKDHTTGSIDVSVSGGTPPYSYEWSNGAATQDLSGLEAGSYSVVVADSNNCTQQIVVVLLRPCDTRKSVILYPNPVSDILHVKMIGYNETVTLSVYNILGDKKLEKRALVSDNDITNMNVQRLQVGFYMLKIVTSGGVVTRWFLKVR